MPNLTITVDEQTLRRLRIEAATRNISVSRFVGEVLKEKFGEDYAYERAMADFSPGSPTSSPPTVTTAAVGLHVMSSTIDRC